MKLLAVDTATPRLVLGLADGEQRWRFESKADPQERGALSTLTSRLLAEAGLTASALDVVAIGVGPGSFAGLRNGMAFARALAWALDRPVVAVDSLECTAAAFLGRDGVRRVRVLLDARMQAVYSGEYVGEPARPEAMQAIVERGLTASIDELTTVAPQGIALVGNALALPGAEPLARRGWSAFAPQALPTADAMLDIALARVACGEQMRADALSPCYVRDRVALTREQRAAGERLETPG